MLDENGARAVLIETKRPKVSLDAEEWRDQAGKYADESTRFVGLTNGYRFLLWQVKDGKRELKVDLDFKTLIESKKTSEEKLSSSEVEQILFLENLRKEEVWSESKYGVFNEYYAKIDISEDTGFEKLIEQLNYVLNGLLKQYTYDAFDEYSAGYFEYESKTKEIDLFEKENGVTRNKKLAQQTADLKFKLDGAFAKYASFKGYYIWKAQSNRDVFSEEENKKVFCKESIYVLINRLLFIRILEDKGLLKKKISNGGIESLREQLDEPLLKNPVYKEILKLSYSGAHAVYPHFYEKGNPLDWYESGDGELDRVLNKTLWILNQFNFSGVDRDVLGKLYEKYLPKDERKQLGEFYTPDEVVDYILDAVDYSPNKAIENKDLIDPACGSGGFLVRATRRLIARYAVKFEKATPKEALDPKKWREVLERLTPKECEEIVRGVAERIHGFDINPFAASITEMNLLFQVIDVYSKAARSNRSFTVPRFKIYRTDSLELPSNQKNLHGFASPLGNSLAKDQSSVEALKLKKYDFVVGNPPYVSIKALSNFAKENYERDFETAKGQYDLYTLFIELGIKHLNEKGRFGFIVPDAFLGRSNAQPIRDLLLVNGLSQALQVYGVFDDPSVANVILITEPNSVDLQIAKIPFEKIGELPEFISLSRQEISKLPNHKILVLTKKESKLLEKIGAMGKPLELFLADLWRGEELGKKADVVKTVPKDVFKKLVFGEDIQRYRIIDSGKFINPLDIKKGEKYFHKKITIRQLGNDIAAAFDAKGEYVTLQSTYNLVPKNNAEYFLGVLNSKLVNWYYAKMFKEKELFPRVLLENLKILPIIDPSTSQVKPTVIKIAKLASDMTELGAKTPTDPSKSLKLENQLDTLVFELYGLTAEERKIVEDAVK
ncbi:MAG: N-6 DNA methylase [Candidatus Micrarchaeia archaeon]